MQHRKHSGTWNASFGFASAVFLCCILISCSSIKVNHGPFEIKESSVQKETKTQFLQDLNEEAIYEDRPNVLLILVDDLSRYDIALYDQSGIRTPQIERLANEGVVFSSAFTSSPVCSPSRAALFTGRYQQRFGFERQPMNRYSRNKLEYFFVDHFLNVEPMRLISPMADVPKEEIIKQGIPGSELLLSEILRQAGYKTGLCGKWHLGNARQFSPTRRGFDFQYGFNEAFTLYSPLNTDGIVEYHHDYFANKHIWRQKRKGSCAITINDSIINEKEYLTFAIARESVDFMELHKDEPFFLVSAFNAPHTPFQVPEEYYNRFSNVRDENKRVYYGMIAALDDAIGLILNALDELNIGENTLVIFASDNGGATYTGATDNGPLQAGKFSQFEGGINIPMIMKWTGNIPSGTVYSEQVSLLDVLPTVLASAGISKPADRKIDGVDLLTYLNRNEEAPHEYLYWRTDYNKAIRSRDWKLIWNTRDGQEFLYDLRENNFERTNVASVHQDVVEKMKKIYAEWEKEMKDPLWPGVMEFKFDIDGVETWWAI